MSCPSRGWYETCRSFLSVTNVFTVCAGQSRSCRPKNVYWDIQLNETLRLCAGTWLQPTWIPTNGFHSCSVVLVDYYTGMGIPSTFAILQPLWRRCYRRISRFVPGRIVRPGQGHTDCCWSVIVTNSEHWLTLSVDLHLVVGLPSVWFLNLVCKRNHLEWYIVSVAGFDAGMGQEYWNLFWRLISQRVAGITHAILFFQTEWCKMPLCHHSIIDRHGRDHATNKNWHSGKAALTQMLFAPLMEGMPNCIRHAIRDARFHRLLSTTEICSIANSRSVDDGQWRLLYTLSDSVISVVINIADECFLRFEKSVQ